MDIRNVLAGTVLFATFFSAARAQSIELDTVIANLSANLDRIDSYRADATIYIKTG
jgi:outer membrane lipoprotein-sorting protein